MLDETRVVPSPDTCATNTDPADKRTPLQLNYRRNHLVYTLLDIFRGFHWTSGKIASFAGWKRRVETRLLNLANDETRLTTVRLELIAKIDACKLKQENSKGLFLEHFYVRSDT